MCGFLGSITFKPIEREIFEVCNKRIECRGPDKKTIQSNKIDIVTDALKEVVGGFTIIEGNGRGSGKRQNIRSERGTNITIAEYNKVSVISTIVDDSIVEKVSKAIEESVFTGQNSDGIIAVSNIESVLNISSKKMDNEAL